MALSRKEVALETRGKGQEWEQISMFTGELGSFYRSHVFGERIEALRMVVQEEDLSLERPL